MGRTHVSKYTHNSAYERRKAKAALKVPKIIRLTQLGLCRLCAHPAPDGDFCQSCHATLDEYGRRHLAKRHRIKENMP